LVNSHQVCDYDVVIAGGGIVGTACAVKLLSEVKKDGGPPIRVKVYEQSTNIKPIGAAIGLLPNGATALKDISPSVHDEVMDASVQLKRILTLDCADGSKVLRDIDVTNSGRSVDDVKRVFVMWYILREKLVQALPPGSFELGLAVKSFEVVGDSNESSDCSNKSTSFSDPFVRVFVESTGERGEDGAQKQQKCVTCRVLVGADGIHSSVRSKLFEHIEPLYHGKVMFRGVAPVDLLVKDGTEFAPAGTQLSYRGLEAGMSFAYRESGKGLLTFTASKKFETPPKSLFEMSKEECKTEIRRIFDTYPHPARRILEQTEAASIHTNLIADIDVLPQWSKGPVVLIGDACHAMTPALAQGANVGLEDACMLARHLKEYFASNSAKHSASDTLEEFWRKRVDRVNEIHHVSRQQTAQFNNMDQQNLNVNRDRTEDFNERLYSWFPQQ
jgi:salicylate hydroxylase